jgi:PhoH-like ATPase
MTITKVIKSVGETIGLLPGSKEEKMMEWLAPFFDNLELILKKSAVTWQNLVTADKLELDALEHIRGRSLMNRWVVIDEMQNCEPAHLKTIVSRIGSGSKLILLGDYSQIDNQYLSKKNNGLVYAINRLYGLDNVGVLQLQKTERSKLAEVAIKHL